jgi:hypothetical protein
MEVDMDQIYHPYWLWEDYKNKMWKKQPKEKELEMLPVAIEFTGDHIKYGSAMLRVIKEWPITCEHNLTDIGINQKAFIGHCAVCLELGIPEYITRLAWHQLTQEQQDKANAAAEFAIAQWISTYRKIPKCQNTQLELMF